ncbi:hypothetical protein OEZ86_006053 [Tetradesmus obliquus]|nr:hypothetical protein OEZ86_006053 [Tetradesmus obliquus]
MDAAELESPTVQLDTCSEFPERFEDARKRLSRSSPKDAEVLSEVLVRMAAFWTCKQQRKPFTQQPEWLAAVKKDPAAAAALLDEHLGLAAGGSSSSSSSSKRSIAVARMLKQIGGSEYSRAVYEM